MSLIDAVIGGASAGELAATPLPERHTAAHVRRTDVGMFAGDHDKDVRRSLHVGELPVPETAPDEVLIAVMASAINYITIWSAMFEPVPTFATLDRLGASGGWNARHAAPYHVLGSDASGVVVRTGAGVRRWSVGDRVVVSPCWADPEEPDAQADAMLSPGTRAWGAETNFGGLAQFAVVKASQLLPKPAHLSWEEAASNTLCGMTAYRMLVGRNGAQLKQGDVVLVWGASGGLGAYAVQLVKNGGGIAVGVVSTDEREAFVDELGCDVVIRRDQLPADPDGVPRGRSLGREIRRRAGEDPHIVFDYLGRQTFDMSVYLARRGGAVVTCGSSTGFRHVFDNRYLWMRLKRIIGSHGANLQEASEFNRLVALGKIVPTVSRVFSLAETAEAARLVQTNQHSGKVGVLCLAPEPGLGITDPALRSRAGLSAGLTTAYEG